MAKSDELDVSRARAFAWRIVDPGEAFDAPPPSVSATATAVDEAPSSVEVTESGARATEAWQEQAFEACRLLAAGVDRAFAIADAAQQAEAVAPLLSRAASLGISLAAMQ